MLKSILSRFINKFIKKNETEKVSETRCVYTVKKKNNTSNKRVRMYKEYFYNKEINILDITDNGIADNTQLFKVPENHFFVMGDNRDNSQDSRFISTVGFIPYENLVGKAQFIFFSLENARFLQIWKWPNSIRYERIFQKIQ